MEKSRPEVNYFRTSLKYIDSSSRTIYQNTHDEHANKNFTQERKYFDSGDYALSKAGKASDVGVTNIGSQHPLPENIPHLSSPGPQNGGGGGGSVGVGHGSNGSGGNNNNSSSTSAANGSNVYGVSGGGGVNGTGPAKEGSLLQKTVSAENGLTQTRNDDGVISPGKEVPVRWQS